MSEAKNGPDRRLSPGKRAERFAENFGLCLGNYSGYVGEKKNYFYETERYSTLLPESSSGVDLKLG